MLGPMEGGTRPRRIHPLVPALVAVVVAAGLVALAASGGDDQPAAEPATTTTPGASPSSTTELPTTTTVRASVPMASLLAPPLRVDPPTSYRISYDVVENGLPRVEEQVVRRPYESLVTSTRDGTLLSGTATSRQALQTFLSAQQGWLILQPELHRAADDQHPAGAVAAMEALGLVERRGEEAYAGRRCTVFRTGQPPSAGAATAPSEEEHTDLCIDEAGLVLHERWEIGGSVVVERTARSVDLEPVLDPATFAPGPVLEDADGVQAAFESIAVKADEETLDRLRTEVTPPTGYRVDGAVFRAADAGGGAPGQEIVRFYSSGPALLEVVEVFVAGPADVTGAAGASVEVEGWDEVWFEPGFRSSALRARIDGSSYVELRHHDVALLFEVLRSIARR
jgi:hypothetical protein